MSELQESPVVPSEPVIAPKGPSALSLKLNALNHDKPLETLPPRIQQWIKLVAEGSTGLGAIKIVCPEKTLNRQKGLLSRWLSRYRNVIALERQRVLDSRVANVREVLEGVTELARQRDDLKVALGSLTKLGEWQGLGAVKGESLSEKQVVKLLMAALGFAQSNDVVDAEVVNEE